MVAFDGDSLAEVYLRVCKLRSGPIIMNGPNHTYEYCTMYMYWHICDTVHLSVYMSTVMA